MNRPDDRPHPPPLDEHAPSVSDAPPSLWAWLPFGDVYAAQRRRAQHDSLAWWAHCVMQGLFIAGGLLALDVLAWGAATFGAHMGLWQAGQALALPLMAWAVLRGLFAPLGSRLPFWVARWRGGTPQDASPNAHEEAPKLPLGWRLLLSVVGCRWQVFVRPTWYAAVEDGDGITRLYLSEGYHTLRWHWGWRVRPYTNIQFVSAREVRIEDVLDSRYFPVRITVSANALFDPTVASPKTYNALRNMADQRVLNSIFKDALQDTIVRFVNGTLGNTPAAATGATSGARALDPAALVEAIQNNLSSLRGLGFVLDTNFPPAVHISYPHDNRLFNRLAQVQNLEDIRQFAREFDLPPEEIARALRFIRGYAPLPPNSAAYTEPVILVGERREQPTPAPAGNEDAPPAADPWEELRALLERDAPPPPMSNHETRRQRGLSPDVD